MNLIRGGISLIFLGCLSFASLAGDITGETITIRNDGDTTYYEFRVNGEITEIKVVPKKGPAYYLIPSVQNEGEFVRKDNPNIRVPSWVIFRW
jgi:hypothetical protein